MLREGHTGLALVMFSPFAFVFSYFGLFQLLVLGGLITIFTAGLPDFDTRTSFVKHRGWTHTVYFAFIVGGGLALGAIYLAMSSRSLDIFWIEVGLDVGMLHVVTAFVFGGYGVSLHILGDIITKQGIRPFTPILPRDLIEGPEKKYAFGWSHAKNKEANIGLAALGPVLVAGAAYIGYFVL